MGFLQNKLRMLSTSLAADGLLIGLAASSLKSKVATDADRQLCGNLNKLGQQVGKTAQVLHVLSMVQELTLEDVYTWTSLTLAAQLAGMDASSEEVAIAQAIKAAADKLPKPGVH